MSIPDGLWYSTDHEWARLEDDHAVIGITDFAQGELGDIIFVEFPKVGQKFSSGDTFGTVEAVKTVADLFMPLDGEIIEVNNALDEEPDRVNSEPYGAGWLVKVKLSAPGESGDLLDAAAYRELIG